MILGQTLIQTANATESVNNTEPATYPLSRDHVNLVRVKDDRITDAVFDNDALEISADKNKGIVFLQVKKKWLATNQDVIGVFFNTETENHAVRFVVSAVPSQTIVLERKTDTKAARKETNTANDKALEMPLKTFGQNDYVRELKDLVKVALTGKNDEDAPEIGLAYQDGAEGNTRFQELTLENDRVSLKGLTLQTTRAFVTQDKLCEVIKLKNMTGRVQKLDVADFLKKVPGILAVSIETDQLAIAQTAMVTIVRSRSAAVAQSQSGVRLSIDFLLDPQ